MSEFLSHSPVLVLKKVPSPLGVLIAGASDEGIWFLDFEDKPSISFELESLMKHGNFEEKIFGNHVQLTELEGQLEEYFLGLRMEFQLPLCLRGSEFQLKVWSMLRQIPYGKTWSYKQLAGEIAQPSAFRAVARANSQNPISILIPCHRVIGINGALTGYAGGIDRKKFLLELECRHAEFKLS